MNLFPTSGQAYNAIKAVGNSWAGTPARELLKATRGAGLYSADHEAAKAGAITIGAGVAVADHIYNTTNDY